MYIKILKDTKLIECISKPLSSVINERWFFLDSLKLSRKVPVFKKGYSAVLSNYRMISLIPMQDKILE